MRKAFYKTVEVDGVKRLEIDLVLWKAACDRMAKVGGVSCPPKAGGSRLDGMKVPKTIVYPDVNDRDLFLEHCGQMWDNSGALGKNGTPNDPADVDEDSNGFAVSILRNQIIGANGKWVTDLLDGPSKKRKADPRTKLMEALAALDLMDTMKDLALNKITDEDAQKILDEAA
jgi:hypothetical protein